jgi:sugar diacid utilization regulator
LVDSAFQLYADEAQPGEQQELLQLIFHNQRTIRKDKSAGQTVFRGMVTLQEQQRIFYYTTALVADGYCYGHLVIQETVVCTPVDLCQYEAVSRFILEELIHRQHSVETERRYQSGFIYDLLYNNFDSNEVLIERGKLWGWDFTKIHHLLIVAIENKGDDYYFEASGILKAIQKAVRAYAPQALICEQQGQIVVIVRKGETEDERTNKKNSITLAKTLQQRMLTAFPDKKIAIGIGKSYPTAGDLCRSYQEAKTALELGPFLQQTNYIIHFEDLGLMRLLAVISYEQLEDYYKEYLACLEEYDTANATNLLETIECYFEQNGDLNTTAEKLYLHPNSLRYRLKKIEDMINGDLQNLEYKLNLFAACKIRKILDNYFWQMSK